MKPGIFYKIALKMVGDFLEGSLELHPILSQS
jgi:hypothetical protein